MGNGVGVPDSSGLAQRQSLRERRLQSRRSSGEEEARSIAVAVADADDLSALIGPRGRGPSASGVGPVAVVPIMAVWRAKARQAAAGRAAAPQLLAVAHGEPGVDGPEESPCMVPSPPSPTERWSGAVCVSWRGVTGAHRYELQYRCAGGDSGGGEWRTVSRAFRVTLARVGGLLPGTRYTFRARARVGEEWSPYSDASGVVSTLPVTPARAVAPTVTTVGIRSITIAWTCASDASTWTVLLGVCDAMSGAVGDTNVLYSGPASSCEARFLQPATTYAMCVIASNAHGDGDASEPLRAMTLVPPTDRPLRVIRDEYEEWWSGTIYFVHRGTGARLSVLPAHLNVCLRRFGVWSEFWDETSQHVFYHNSRTDVRTWEPPEDVCESPFELTACAEGGGGCSGQSRGRGFVGGDAGSMTALERNSGRASAAADARVVDFRKKRFRLLWSARVGTVSPGIITLDIRREFVMADSLCALRRLSRDDMQRRIAISFRGENGIDQGGLTKDWTMLLSHCAAKTFFRQHKSGVIDVDPGVQWLHGGCEHMRLMGRFVGKAVFDRQLCDLPWSRGLCNFLCTRTSTLADLVDVESELAAGLRWSLDNAVSGVLDDTNFSVMRVRSGDGGPDGTRAPMEEVVDLIVDGRHIQVRHM